MDDSGAGNDDSGADEDDSDFNEHDPDDKVPATTILHMSTILATRGRKSPGIQPTGVQDLAA